jgi:hypothetical protein
MKKALLLFSLIATHIFSQEYNFNDLAIGNATRGVCTSYFCKNGDKFKIGDTLKIGTPSNGNQFSYITEGDGFKIPITSLTSIAVGRRIEIKRINVMGDNKTGFFISLKCKGLGGAVNYDIDLEKAIASGEIKTTAD